MTVMSSENDYATPRDRLIVALDFKSARDAQALVARLGDSVSFYKVGLQLFAAEGPDVVRHLVGSGKKVFLDLKFHDIPNTVAGAVRSAADLGVTMLTVHASGGRKMLETAVAAAKESSSKPAILAVTMLTSLGQDSLPELGLSGAVEDNVVRMAKVAKTAGCQGVVASPLEASQVRKAVGSEMWIVTPGIRSSTAPSDDQARTTSPTLALRAGATHLVVGRPITAASDPAHAARSILEEMTLATK